MLKIVDVVDGVFNQLKEHGLAEHTLQQSMWSVYIKRILRRYVLIYAFRDLEGR